MTTLISNEIGARTLANRLSEGRMCVEEALHYATLLGETLRQFHDIGKVHGAVSAETILLTDNGIELMPAPAAQDGAEDVSSDIFGFGTVLCEMLTSPRFLRGGNPADAQPIQNPAMERLIAGCLARDSAERLPSMQKAMLELKLASLSARHAGASTARQRDLDARDAGIQEAEARQDARIREHEARVAEKQQAASEALVALENTIQSQSRKIAMLEARLEDDLLALEKRIAAQNAILESVRASLVQTDDLVGRVVEAFETKLAAANQSVEDNSTRLDRMEQTVHSANRQTAVLDAQLASAIRKFDGDIECQTAIVEKVRTSMAQTDDLVGRVVEAVEGILLDLGTVRV
jgi:hypothetical protein